MVLAKFNVVNDIIMDAGAKTSYASTARIKPTVGSYVRLQDQKPPVTNRVNEFTNTLYDKVHTIIPKIILFLSY